MKFSKELHEDTLRAFEDNDSKTGFTDDVVKTILDEIERLTAELAELRERTRWIPVSERLPEEKQSVLALDRTGTAYHWEYSRSLSNIFVGYYTHWMPMPEPPEVV